MHQSLAGVCTHSLKVDFYSKLMSGSWNILDTVDSDEPGNDYVVDCDYLSIIYLINQCSTLKMLHCLSAFACKDGFFEFHIA